jgi:DNA polymerase elongation subunit (family B)
MPFQLDQHLAEPVAILSATAKNTKKGDQYWQLEVCTPAGKLEAKIWGDTPLSQPPRKNTVAYVEGVVAQYQNSQYLTITKFKPEPTLAVADFLPTDNLTPTLVFDIETVGQDFSELDDAQQTYLLTKLEKQETDPEVAQHKTGLHPLFGFVSHIGLFNPDSGKGKVIGLVDKTCRPSNPAFEYIVCETEKELLETFWKIAAKFQRFVTYNGHNFDFPFLLFRSAVNRVVVPIELDFRSANMIDLMNKLRPFGSRAYSLEMVNKALGIFNPKADGVNGSEVYNLFKQGRCQEIVDYVSRDVKATAELYEVWKTYLAGKPIL